MYPKKYYFGVVDFEATFNGVTKKYSVNIKAPIVEKVVITVEDDDDSSDKDPKNKDENKDQKPQEPKEEEKPKEENPKNEKEPEKKEMGEKDPKEKEKSESDESEDDFGIKTLKPEFVNESFYERARINLYELDREFNIGEYQRPTKMFRQEVTVSVPILERTESKYNI